MNFTSNIHLRRGKSYTGNTNTIQLKNECLTRQKLWEFRRKYISQPLPISILPLIPPRSASVSKSGRKCRPFISKTEWCQTTAADSLTKSAVLQPAYSTTINHSERIARCPRRRLTILQVVDTMFHFKWFIMTSSIIVTVRYHYDKPFVDIHACSLKRFTAGWKPIKDYFFARVSSI